MVGWAEIAGHQVDDGGSNIAGYCREAFRGALAHRIECDRSIGLCGFVRRHNLIANEVLDQLHLLHAMEATLDPADPVKRVAVGGDVCRQPVQA